MWVRLLVLFVALVIALVWARSPLRSPDIARVMLVGLTSDSSEALIPGVAFKCGPTNGPKTCSTDVGGQRLIIKFTQQFASYCTAQFAGLSLRCDGTLEYAPRLKPFVRLRLQPMSTPRPYKVSTVEKFVHGVDTLLFYYWPIIGLLAAAATAVLATLAIAKRLRPAPPEGVGTRFALLVCGGFVLFCVSVVAALIGFLILGYED